jgi:hypothetical protein
MPLWQANPPGTPQNCRPNNPGGPDPRLWSLLANIQKSGAGSRLSEHILLQSERLYLRRFRQEDAPLLFALNSDPEPHNP